MKFVIEIADEDVQTILNAARTPFENEDVQKILEALKAESTKKSFKKAHLTEIVREAAIALHQAGDTIFSAVDIYQEAVTTYEDVNLQSLKLRVIGCAPNHPSYQHQTTTSDFLTLVDRGKYSLVAGVVAELEQHQVTVGEAPAEVLAECMRNRHARAVSD